MTRESRAPTPGELADYDPHGPRISLYVEPLTNGNRLRTVVASARGEPIHRDRFDTDQSWLRERFAQHVVALTGSDEERAASIADDIVRAADEADTKALEGGDQFGEPIMVSMADVESRPVEWLWPDRIPLGKLSQLAGDPGTGKSLVYADTMARLTCGRGWPDGPPRSAVGSCILLTSEDALADTVRPRLDAAGADVARVSVLRAVRSADDSGRPVERFVRLDHDVETLARAIDRTPDCRLVVIDPIDSYLGKTDSHRNADVRGILGPLADLAERRGVAVLMIQHHSKITSRKAIHRSSGSLAFVAAARSAWALLRDPESTARRLMLPVKANLSPEVRGLAFGIVTAHNNAPCIAWELGTVDTTADEIMAAAENSTADTSDRADAKTWLAELLSDGPLAAAEVRRMAAQNGHAWRTVTRAKAGLGVASHKVGYGAKAGWEWSLTPNSATEESQFP